MLSFAAGDARAGDPLVIWRTIETPHFVITYQGRESRLAQRLAVVAEDAHRKLSPLLDHSPKQKTQVLLTDDSDDSNGDASVTPNPTVHLFATAPDDRSELGDYDDWLSALITHEYTHILHLDTIHGVARVINAILGFGGWGQLYAPNQGQPRFVIEGLAVFEETEHTSGGRLRSTIYDMYMRAASLEGKFQRLDQFTNSPLQWPRGASPYLYGSAFLRYIASLYGSDVLRRLSHDYGGNWIVGGMSRSLRRVTGGKSGGKTFGELYEGYRDSMQKRYERQLATVEERGRVEGVALTEPREYAVRPTFTPDGRFVVWGDADGTSRSRLRSIPVGGGPLGTVLLVDSVGGSTFSPDGNTVYFNAVEVHRTLYYYNDLFSFDRRTGVKRQLSFGLRATEPDLSPDGRTLAFAVNESSSRSLAIMSVDGSAAGRGPRDITRIVGNLDDLSQIYTPSWSPDGKTIAFSWWRDGGYRDIWTVDVATRALTRLTADRAIDMDPRYSPDGKWIYFSSDRTGIYNLYARENATGQIFQVTNVIGGAFDPAISPDGRTCAFVGFVADGFRLERIDLDSERFRPAPPAIEDHPEAEPVRVEHQLPDRAYSPWRTLLPRSLGITSYPDAFGQVIGLSVSGSDLIGHHQWGLALGFSLARPDDISVGAGYSYNGLFPSFSFSANRTLTRRGGFIIDGINRAYVEDDYTLNASVTLPIYRRIDRSANLSFTYNFAYLKNADLAKLPLDPNLISPVLPETGRVASLGVTFNYSNIRRYTYSISNQQGRALSLNLGVSEKGIGSEYNVVTASWRWVEYIPSFFKNQVLALSYAGGFSGGELRRRGVFFVGGYAPQADILRSVFDFTRPGSASLRGYAYNAIQGDQFHLVNAEYRFPIVRIEHGYQTFPVYLQRLHGAVFVDVGNAFTGPFDPKQLKVGAGAELRLDLQVFYYLGAALQLGYAHGFTPGGVDHQVYFFLNNPF